MKKRVHNTNSVKYGFTFSHTEQGLWVYVEKQTNWYGTKKEMTLAATIICDTYKNDPNFKIKFKKKVLDK